MMDLSTTQHRILASMPDLAFGDSKSIYARRIMTWAGEVGECSVDAVKCANIRWEAWEMQMLLDRIQAGDDAALRRAVTLIITDRYIP